MRKRFFGAIQPRKSSGASSPASFNVTSGYIPFTVFCDFGSITDPGATRPFHDLQYTWTVTDSGGTPVGGGNWTYGRPCAKTVQVGPTACFEFRSAGSFKIKLDVYNGTTTTTYNQDITATDPVGAPGITIHAFSTSGTYTGAPAGATTHGSISDLDSIISTYAASNTMLVFRGGETFVTDQTRMTLAGLSNVYIGGYSGFGAGLPKFQSTSVAANSAYFSTSGTVTDIKFVDLEADGQSNTKLTFRDDNASTAWVRMLISGCYIHDMGGGLQLGPSRQSALADGVAVVNTRLETFSAAAGNATEAIYLAGKRLAVIGCNLSDTNHGSAEHLLRIEYLNKGVVRSNTVALSAANKEMISLRCSEPSSYPSLGLTATEYVCISDNVILNDQYAGLDVTPVNDVTDTGYIVSNVIIERNYWNHTDAGTTSIILRSTDNVTIRNEIFEGGLAMSTAVETKTTVAAGINDGVDIFDCSYYTTLSSTDAQPLRFTDSATNVGARNIVAWAPNLGANGAFVIFPAAGSYKSGSPSNNTSNANAKSPAVRPYTGAAPATQTDYVPNPSGNPDIRGAGTTAATVKVFCDYNTAARPASGNIDMGAVEV